MKGHIRQRGKASWAIVLDLGRNASGKRKQKWHTVQGSKRAAQRELARLLHEINTGAYVEPSKMTLSEYLDRWLLDYAKSNVSPKTYERYEEIIRSNIVPTLGSYALSKLKPLHIQGFYTGALTKGRKDGRGGLSAQTVLHFHRVLHKALDQAVKWQLLARNPADAVEPPRAHVRQMRALNGEETAALLALVTGTRLYMPVLLAVAGGMRRGEILALRWKDCEIDTGKVVIARSLEQTREGLRVKLPKTDRGRRTVVMPSFACDALRAHRAQQAKRRLALGPGYRDEGLICPREDGSPWPPDSLSTAFAALVRRSGQPHIRFHDLRHTHATQLLQQGVHPKIVSERLGHSSIGITLDTYSHVLPGMQEEAMSLFDASLRSYVEKRTDSD